MTKSVAVVGDAFLDVVCNVSSELVQNTQMPAFVSVALGGTAASVALSAANDGANVQLWAPRARDNAAHLLTQWITDAAVQWHWTPQDATGVVTCIATPTGLKFLVKAREQRDRLCEVNALSMKHVGWIHLTGHWLFDTAPTWSSLAHVVARWRSSNARISIDLANRTRVAAIGQSAIETLLAIVRPDLFVCSSKEATIVDLASLLRRHGCRAVVTNSAQSISIVESGFARYVPIRNPVRVSSHALGAGDVFAGSLISNLHTGIPLAKAVQVAAGDARERVHQVATSTAGQ